MNLISPIDLNYRLYEAQKSALFKSGTAKILNETTIEFAKRIAKYGSTHFTGLLADHELDEFLAESSLATPLALQKPSSNGRIANVLHIASELFNVGGHTRVLLNWIEADTKRKNHVLLLRGKASLPANLSARFSKAASTFRHLSQSKELAKLSAARKYINQVSPDVIILHTHPEEVLVPLLFGQKRKTRVFSYNHADHLYWIGSRVIDGVIEFRPNASEVTQKFRGTTSDFVLPYPLEPQPPLTKSQAKDLLGIPQEQTILLTMASEHKLLPFGDANFFNFANHLLEKMPSAVMCIIGISPKASWLLDGLKNKERFKLLGIVEDPQRWCTAASFFVEPTPLITGLGAFDTLRHGSKLICSWQDCSIYGEGVHTMLPPELLSIALGRNAPKSSMSEYTDAIVRNIDETERHLPTNTFWTSLVGENYLAFLDELYRTLENKESPGPDSVKSPIRMTSTNAMDYAEYCNRIWPPYEDIAAMEHFLLREACKLEKIPFKYMKLVDRMLGFIKRRL